MHELLISVIVTVYNTEPTYLKECICSIQKQRIQDIEIIIVDDGSKLPIANMCDEFAEYDDRIRVIHQENAGASAARNAGIKVANGQYLTIIDSDDWLEAESLEVLVSRAQKDNSDILIWNTNVIMDNLVIKNYFMPESIKQKILTKEEVKVLQIQMIFPGFEMEYKPQLAQVGGTWCKLYKRTFLSKNKLLYKENIKMFEDPIFNLEAFEKATKVLYVCNHFYNYRIVSNSITRGYKADWPERYINAFYGIRDLLNEIKAEKRMYLALDAKIQMNFSNLIGNYFLHPLYKGNYFQRKKEFIDFYNQSIVNQAEKKLYFGGLEKDEQKRRKMIQKGNFLMLYLLYGRACMPVYQSLRRKLCTIFRRVKKKYD